MRDHTNRNCSLDKGFSVIIIDGHEEDMGLARRHSAGSIPVPMRTLLVLKMQGWTMALATGLVLLLSNYDFAGNLEYGVGTWEVPSGQPIQMQSEVDYAPTLTDPFFKSNKWSYPWYIIKHPDGHFEDTTGGKSSKKEPPRLKPTANCFSDAYGADHLLRFCEARLLDPNMIDLFIHENNASHFDALKIQIRNHTFSCQYWALYPGPGEPGMIWMTKQQKLTLDRKAYQKGDVIRGKIDLECVAEPTNPEYIKEWGRNPRAIRISGVFKTILE